MTRVTHTYHAQPTERLDCAKLQRLHEGTLLFAPNQPYARAEDLDAKIRTSNQRLEKLCARLAAHIEEADVLLGEVVTR